MEHTETHSHEAEHPTQQPAPSSEAFIIKLTEKAVEMVKEALKAENFPAETPMRVAVVGGGCSGYQYGLDFAIDDKGNFTVEDDDLIFEQDGVKVVMDQYSATYLKGTQIDYVSDLNRSGFKFINPNAQRTCGCGSSFSA